MRVEHKTEPSIYNHLSKEELLEYLKFYFIETQQKSILAENLNSQLKQALEINCVIAESLGACPECFGQNDECTVCHGQGSPGWKQPDSQLFEYLVTPALTRHFKRQKLSA